MTEITIIGAGRVAGSIASIAVRGGAQVQLLGRDQEKVAAAAQQAGAHPGRIGDAITGDVVVLAVPYPAVAGLVEQYRDQLDGRIVVDVSNPVDFATLDSLTVPADSSSAAALQELLPRATVVKAFNTNLAPTLVAGTLGDAVTTVLVAGDDEPAKQVLIDLVTAGGLKAVSAGSLSRARELEAMGFLQITLAARGVIPLTGGFAVHQ
jgi:predicted dinucleotide-binding enzyme